MTTPSQRDMARADLRSGHTSTNIEEFINKFEGYLYKWFEENHDQKLYNGRDGVYDIRQGELRNQVIITLIASTNIVLVVAIPEDINYKHAVFIRYIGLDICLENFDEKAKNLVNGIIDYIFTHVTDIAYDRRISSLSNFCPYIEKHYQSSYGLDNGKNSPHKRMIAEMRARQQLNPRTEVMNTMASRKNTPAAEQLPAIDYDTFKNDLGKYIHILMFMYGVYHDGEIKQCHGESESKWFNGDSSIIILSRYDNFVLKFSTKPGCDYISAGEIIYSKNGSLSRIDTLPDHIRELITSELYSIYNTVRSQAAMKKTEYTLPDDAPNSMQPYTNDDRLNMLIRERFCENVRLRDEYEAKLTSYYKAIVCGDHDAIKSQTSDLITLYNEKFYKLHIRKVQHGSGFIQQALFILSHAYIVSPTGDIQSANNVPKLSTDDVVNFGVNCHRFLKLILPYMQHVFGHYSIDSPQQSRMIIPPFVPYITSPREGDSA